MTPAQQWIDSKLAELRHAGQRLTIEPVLTNTEWGSVDAAHCDLTKRHPSFRVVRMLCDDSLVLIKRARISRNRWL